MPDELIAQDRASRRARRVEQIIVIMFSLVVSLPFCNKAFHIDDPLYLSIARQILVDPLRPYDALINWQQVTEPAWRVSISPPGYSYWLAGWMAAGVTTEWGLHCVGSLWVVMLGLATHAWASRLGDWPLAATLLLISSPIVVAGQNLMLDVPMLALAASAMVAYQRASDTNSIQWALVAGLLAGLSVNFKYAGGVAIGVMAIDAILWRRWRLLAAAALSTTLLVLVQMTIACRAGTPQLLFARQWITRLWPSDASDMLHRISASVVYLGASVAWFWLLARAVFVRGKANGFATLTAAIGAGVLAIADMRSRESIVGWSAIIQAAAFASCGGLVLFWLATEMLRAAASRGWQWFIDAWWSRQDAHRLRQGIMLVTWTVGFWYLGVLNGPFVAPRALLPCALSFALATLAVVPAADSLGRLFIRGSVALTLLFGLLVGASDYRWAGIYRGHAPRLAQKYRPPHGTIYFLGHWGWQHYAQAAGMVQFDPSRTRLVPGDVIVWPRNVDYPIPVSLITRGCHEVARDFVPANSWLPRTRCPEGLIFLHGDTDRGRIPWGWATGDPPQEAFVILRFDG